MSHSEGQGKTSWLVVSFSGLFVVFLHGPLLSPLLPGVCAHSQITTGIQTNRFCLAEQLACPPSVLFRLGMTADPESQRAGGVSMSHITGCWQGPTTLTPDPFSCGCRQSCVERQSVSWLCIPGNPGNGCLPFYLACICFRRSSTSIFVNAEQMHTHACACFLACFWDQASLAMGRREGPTNVHLPTPLVLCHCKTIINVLLIMLMLRK